MRKKIPTTIMIVLIMTGIEILFLGLSFFTYEDSVVTRIVILAFPAASFAGILLCQTWGRIVSIIYHILMSLAMCASLILMLSVSTSGLIDPSIGSRDEYSLFYVFIFGLPVVWGIIVILLLTVNRSTGMFFKGTEDVKTLEESIDLV